jgi:carbamoyl-phosphate synthase large subunit
VEAVDAAVDLGLFRTGGLLVRFAARERDPAVLDALAEAVAARQWEPAATQDVVRLRRWARDHAEDRRAAAAGPSQRRRTARVLITGAGGPAGVAVIRNLVRRGVHVVAVDADELAVGFGLASEGYVVPTATEPDYLSRILEVAAATRVDALLCTVAEEYPALRAHALDAAGIRSMLPSPESVRVCLDKWAFAHAMEEAGLPVPATRLRDHVDIPKPWIVKPRFGRGSRDVHVARTLTDLRRALRWTPDPIVQALVEGREFTVDALVGRDGAVAGMSPRWRLETKAGISTKGLTFSDPKVVRTVERVLVTVGLVGPANVQGFVTKDGDVVVLEVNPRFSGGLPLTLHAGADLVGEYVRAILGKPIRPERLVARPGVAMSRYFDEVFAA